MAKALILFGTRPELIKMMPVIYEMQNRGCRENIVVVNTAQHKELLTNTLGFLSIKADITLDVMVPGQSLNELCARALMQFQGLLNSSYFNNEKPSMILAQGDTATAFAGAITAFHNKIPFVHVEAGLRTHDFNNPFPEEFYRRAISIYAAKYFTPTFRATCNLLKEGIDSGKIQQSGNTIVDAIQHIQKIKQYKEDSNLPQKIYREIKNKKRKFVLVTCHRRENFGVNAVKIIKTVKELAAKHPDLKFIWVLHPNPSIKKLVQKSGLHTLANVHVIPPLDYFDMILLYPALRIILTDSGGIQEEAPSFKIPVIVLRETTERSESVEKGYAALCGTNKSAIKKYFSEWIHHPPNIKENPYGDGKSAKRIVDYMITTMNLRDRKKKAPKKYNGKVPATF